MNFFLRTVLTRPPRLILFLLAGLCINMVLFTLLRVVFYFFFNENESFAISNPLWFSFYIGFKFDLRLSLIIHLPVMVLGWIPSLSPTGGSR